MKYTLFGYQNNAVSAACDRLGKARKYTDDGDLVYFSLSATTGAGKTVMAAAIIESILYGSTTYGHAADPDAVILWFSDSPDLNEQTRDQFRSSSSELSDVLQIIPTTFNNKYLDPGKVYFLNTQKLSKSSKLSQSGSVNGLMDEVLGSEADQSSFSQVLAETAKRGSRVYLIVDEAHRGMKSPQGRKTIVQNLINGDGVAPAIPIVMGISATIDNFDKTMSASKDRTRLAPVSVPASEVQQSGLLKDRIVLTIPDEKGDFTQTLIREAMDRYIAMTKAWDEYTTSTGEEQVVPALVFQVPDKVTDEDMMGYVNSLRSHPDHPLDEHSFAHVFGEHTHITTSDGTVISYCEPQDVEGSPHIRVVFAKTAISTGWNAPRAEVMLSLRSYIDVTAITQIIGRMVRTPLARRIATGDPTRDEMLGSTYCILPKFNRDTVEEVSELILHGGTDTRDDLIDGRDVVVNPQTLTANTFAPQVTEDVTPEDETYVEITDAPLDVPVSPVETSDDPAPVNSRQSPVQPVTTAHSGRNELSSVTFSEIATVTTTVPSYDVPTQRKGNPISDLLALSTFIAENISVLTVKDRSGAQVTKITTYVKERLLDQITHMITTTHHDQIKDTCTDIMTFSGADITVDLHGASVNNGNTFDRVVIDDAAFSDAEKIAHRKIDSSVIVEYARRVMNQSDPEDDLEEVIREAKLQIFALSMVDTALEDLQNFAQVMFTDLLEQISRDVLLLSDRDRARYETFRLSTGEPMRTTFVLPESMSAPRRGAARAPYDHKHVLVDDHGHYHACFTGMEKQVIEAEAGRKTCVAWYRNPSRGRGTSLRIPYQSGDKWQTLYPDFVFYYRGADGQIKPGIVDPHSGHLSDSRDKMTGFARYAQRHHDQFARMEIVTGTDDGLVMIDVMDPVVRSVVLDTDATAEDIVSRFGKQYC